MSDYPTETTPTASSPETPTSSLDATSYSGPEADWSNVIDLTPYLGGDSDWINAELAAWRQPETVGTAFDRAQDQQPGIAEKLYEQWAEFNLPIDDDELARAKAAHPAGKRLRLQDVLDPTDFELAVAEATDELADLLVRKQTDYGPHAINRAPGGAVNGVLVRAHDKLSRLAHLTATDNPAAPEFESVRDSFVDLANYAIIGLLLVDGRWPQ